MEENLKKVIEKNLLDDCKNILKEDLAKFLNITNSDSYNINDLSLILKRKFINQNYKQIKQFYSEFNKQIAKTANFVEDYLQCTKTDRRKWEKEDKLKVVDYVYVQKFGKPLKSPLYDAYNLYKINKSELDKWKMTKRQKAKLLNYVEICNVITKVANYNNEISDETLYKLSTKIKNSSINNREQILINIKRYCEIKLAKYCDIYIDYYFFAKIFLENIINETNISIETLYKDIVNKKELFLKIIDESKKEYNDLLFDNSFESIEFKLIKIIKKIDLLERINCYKELTVAEKSRLKDKLVKHLIENSKKIVSIFSEKYDIKLSFEYVDYLDLLKYNSTINYIKNSESIKTSICNIIKKSFPEHPKDQYIKARGLKRKFIIHYGETNSGKTHEGIEALKKSERGIYLAPLRLLALEIYERLNSEGVLCDLLTGEEEKKYKNAGHTASTIEKLNINEVYDVVVIDEAQLISDNSRGWAWTRAILAVCANEIHICCSYNAVDIIIKLIEDCDDNYRLIEHFRDTQLEVEDERFVFPDDVLEGDALIVFSRRGVLAVAAQLDEIGIKSSVIYGSLPPDTRKKQVYSFLNRETEVVVSTDAVGMGMNLPIKRVVFLEIKKFDGFELRNINNDEILQIAGRAGRKGMYNKGLVNSLKGKKIISKALKLKELKVIDSIYLFPDKELFDLIEFGSIKNIMESWQNYNYASSNFKKTDLSHQIDLLKYIFKRESNQNRNIIYKLCCIPFDDKYNELKSLWKEYADNILDGNKVEFPNMDNDENLEELELYFKKLDMYFNINKVFSMECNYKKIDEEKIRISKLIHKILLSDIKTKFKHCDVCGNFLEWNSDYNLCEKCFHKFL